MSRTYESEDEKNTVSELVSAVIDDEASISEVSRVIDKLGDEVEVRNKVKRFSLIGDVLRHKQVKYSMLDVSSKVRREIEEGRTSNLNDIRSILSKLNLVSLWSTKWNYAIKYVALASVVAVVVVMLGRVELNEIGRLSFSYVNNHSKQSFAPEDVDYNVERSGVSQYTLNENDNVLGVLAGVNSLLSSVDDTLQQADYDSELESMVQNNFYSHMIQHAGQIAVVGHCGWLSLARFSAVSTH